MLDDSQALPAYINNVSVDDREEDGVFMFTGKLAEDEKSTALASVSKQREEYIVTNYNIETDEEVRSRTAKIEMLKNINSKQVELHSRFR